MYYADFDSDSGLFCVFNTDTVGRFKAGHAFASYATMEQAVQDANERNEG